MQVISFLCQRYSERQKSISFLSGRNRTKAEISMREREREREREGMFKLLKRIPEVIKYHL